MKIIGLVGGIGSGKSTVARLVRKHADAFVIDVDRLGHEVLCQDEVKILVHARWGAAPFGNDGEIDRHKMAEIVFSGTEEGNANLENLTAISHPRIAELLKSRLETAKMANRRLVLLDAPLLLESGWDRLCDAVIFIDAPEQVRRVRVLKRGWTFEEFQARTANQLPLDTKRKASQWVIENTCSLVELEQRVAAVLNQVLSF